MARRDELTSEVARLGGAARQDSAKADAAEAKVRKAEEKRKEDRACVELLLRELEARCREAAAAQEEQKLAAANLERQRQAGEAEARPWRLAAKALFVALVLASLVQ